MSYIGIVGPYGVGKTTITDSILQFDLTAVQDSCVTVVNCDNNRERWLSSEGLATAVNKQWQASVAEKHAAIAECVESGHLFICETAWTDHISGMAKLPTALLPNVVDFIVVTVAPDIFRTFLQERCQKRNKEFRADYWDDKRLVYEGTKRPLNAAIRYLTATGIRWQHYEMDYERTVWDEILVRLYDDIKLWYKH